jgi:peroxiredoxin
MVLMHSNTADFPCGTPAPPFTLPEPLTGAAVSLGSAAGPTGTLVAFLSCHCPFVIHIRSTLRALAADLRELGIFTIAISANDVKTYPEDGPEHMAALARRALEGVPFLYDAGQDVAKLYKAKCTPDFYLFDGELKLVYRGRIDGSTPGNGVPSDGAEIRAAAKALAAGRPIDQDAIRPSVGCSIKWAHGNAPTY